MSDWATMPSYSGRIILVGASTGGTEAIKVLLAGMPAHAPPILITQHMPEAFTESFVTRLDGLCAMQVCVAEHGSNIAAGHGYISPGHSHMSLERPAGGACRIVLNQDKPVNHHRPAVEVLFHAAAKVLGSRAVGVMLTGMGKDGSLGMLAMHRAGAYNFAQDEASCVVFGMPRAAIEVGAVDEIVPLGNMAARILAYLKIPK